MATGVAQQTGPAYDPQLAPLRSMRCGCNVHPGQGSHLAFSPSDCAFSTNLTTSEYDPGVLYEINVVVHVISNSMTAGAISDQDIIEQIERLNEDFSGQTLGQGNNAGIRFRFATEDPSGAPTNGITRTVNDVWFQDVGGYASALSWDSRRYMNVFTLDVGGGLTGYVPNVPQGGAVGSTSDRIVMDYEAINDSEFKWVLAHEVGHYLGLFHTWSGNTCSNTICHAQGDLICDTAPHRDPTQICTVNQFSCSVVEPSHNFMNYLDITCVYEFTPVQIQRMRCTLENWRSSLATIADVGVSYCQATPNSSGMIGRMSATGSPVASANSLTMTASSLPPNQFGIFVTSRDQGFVPGGGGTSNGNICLGGLIGRLNRPGEIKATGPTGEFTLLIDLTGLPQGNGVASVAMGETWNFQAWHRDGVGLGSNFTEGLEVVFQ